MYNLTSLLLFIISVLAATIYGLQNLEVALPLWISCYVNDFLCLPIVIGYEQLLFRWVTGSKEYKFSIGFILAMAAYYSFYFEFYLPEHNERYTSDLIDVMLYFLGAICFYILNRLPATSQYKIHIGFKYKKQVNS